MISRRSLLLGAALWIGAGIGAAVITAPREPAFVRVGFIVHSERFNPVFAQPLDPTLIYQLPMGLK